MKRLKDLKDKQKKLKHKLRKLFNPAILKAQTQKWTEHEEKKAKMMQEYKNQISFRVDTLPITKINYVLNSRKEGEQPADLHVVDKESAPPASDAKINDGKELVFYKSEDKKSEGIISVEDNLDEDDKKPLSKRFKIMNPIPNIPNPTPLNIFVPE
nr:hypothetical protein [Tanacetum cinerariifolium]